MARSKQPAGYPTVYREVIEAVIAQNKTLNIPCETNKRAQLTRFQFYDFIKACRKSANEREREIGEQAYGLVFSVRGDMLSISIRDTSADAMLVKNSLQEFLGEKPISPAGATSRPLPSPAASSYHPPQTGITPSDAQEDMINSFMKGEKR